MTQFFDLMIDTETAGLPPTGALLSIGACFFDLHTQTIGPTFNRELFARDVKRLAAEAAQWRNAHARAEPDTACNSGFAGAFDDLFGGQRR